VIIDRHPMWVQAFTQLLNRVGLEVLAHASDPDELVSLVEEHRPDVVVIELDPANEGRGVSDLRNALGASADLKVIVVSDHADVDTIEALFAEGASAYCTKAAAPDDFAAAIRQSFHRSVYLAGVSRGAAASPSWNRRDRKNDLTRRESEILALVAEGHSNSQLARMLWVTEQTVKFHLSNIYRKLDVANRTEASRWAQLNGLLPDKRREPAAV
jgi:DNA-binding NarL/FixJ family response regulator